MASAIRHRFNTKFSRDRSGTAAHTPTAPIILATTGPAAQQAPRRSAIQIESAMARLGTPRTPQKDAARQRSKAVAARAFSTVSRLTDIHRLAYALCGRSVSAPCSSPRLLRLALDFTARSRTLPESPQTLAGRFIVMYSTVDGEGRESSRLLEIPRESARMWQMYLEFSCMPSLVPAGTLAAASCLGLTAKAWLRFPVCGRQAERDSSMPWLQGY